MSLVPLPSFKQNLPSEKGLSFSRPFTPVCASSPASESSSTLPRTSPAHLLDTPPVSDWQPRQDGGYFSTRSNRSTYQITRISSPLDNRSYTSYLSPGLSSGGSDSYQSSDDRHSMYSNSSSEFLSPPQSRVDTDSPPYKTRRQSSESLIMTRKIRRANSMPDGKKTAKRKYKRRHKFRNKKFRMYGHKDSAYWWLSGCQVAPTAPFGRKDLCEDHVGHYVPRTTRLGNIDTYGGIAHDPEPNATRSLTNRRWSSVEIGAHPFLLQPWLPQMTNTSEANAPHDSTPSMPSQRHRSSTYTRGAIDHDVLHTVRERLTLRKLPKAQLNTPVSITLRRASSENLIAKPTVILGSIHSQDQSLDTVQRYNAINERRSSDAYLITSKDIETITQLIEANLKRKYEAQSLAAQDAKTLTGSLKPSTRRPSITDKGLLPASSALAEFAITLPGVEPIHMRPQNPIEYLQVATATKSKTDWGIARIGTDKTISEVIWEGGGSSARSVSDVTDEGDQSHTSAYICYPEQNTPGDSTKNSLEVLRVRSSSFDDKGDAFDPRNARASINEWSFRCPQNDLAVSAAADTFDSDSGESETAKQYKDHLKKALHFVPETTERRSSKLKPYLRYTASETKLQDVVSFPSLLSRKTTSDWYSPLPDLVTSKPPLATSQSLHNMGLDITVRPASEDFTIPKASATFHSSIQDSLTHSSAKFEVCTHKSVESVPNSPRQPKRAAVTFSQAHPIAPSRLGNEKSIGSSLGASSHLRKSSTPGLKRVRTVDNPHKGDHDPCTKWRKPSVCPPHVPPSPTEYEDAREDWIEDDTAEIEGRIDIFSEGMALDNLRRLSIRLGIPEKNGSPLLRAESVGNYRKMSDEAKAGRKANVSGVNWDGRDRSGTCVGHGSGEMSCGTHDCHNDEVDPRTPSVDWIG